MAVTGFISSEHVVGRVVADFAPGDNSWLNDAGRWIGEAIELIGVFSGFVKKRDFIEVHGHRAKIPCFVEAIDEVCYKGHHLRYGNNNNAQPHQKKDHTKYNTHVTPRGIANPEPDNSLDNDYFEIVYDDRREIPWYIINGNWFQTSFETGELEVVYQTINVDENGYPMIPQNVEYIRAISWYIVRMLVLRGYRIANFEFDYCDQTWLRYCQQAANACAFPSIDKQQRLTEMFVNLMPATLFTNEKDVNRNLFPSW